MADNVEPTRRLRRISLSDSLPGFDSVTSRDSSSQSAEESQESSPVVLNGRYRVDTLIGNGGMARVYKAFDITLDRYVAVKVILPQYAKEQDYIARFEQEAKTAARIQNPHIVSIYDWGIDDSNNVCYIVMELLQGTDMKHLIRSKGSLSCEETANIISMICSGLIDAHDNGIIHRDIKPQNIMVDSQGNAKLMDFGIAKPIDSDITSTNKVLGTAHYISPEQTRGLEIGPMSDIYSLGIVMYEAVTGRLPFDGEDAITIALKHVQEEAEDPSSVNPEVDTVFERIILKCLTKDPNDRFQTASELKGVLDDYLQGRVISQNRLETYDLTTKLQMPENVYMDVAETQDSKRDNLHKIIIAILGAFIILAMVFGIPRVRGLFQQESPIITVETVQVPSIVGMTRGEAENALQEIGLKLGNVREEYSDDVAVNKIIRQNPVPETEAEKDSEVDVVVSLGKKPPETVVVPALSGMSKDDAVKALEGVGLVASVQYEHSDTVPKDQVIGQSPQGGTTVQLDNTVTITVSQGAEALNAPNVVGMTEEDAKNAILSYGFSVGDVTREYSDDTEEGIVMLQSIQGEHPKGTPIDLTVSAGKESVTIPGLVGKTVQEAMNALYDIGLNPVVEGDSDLDAIVQSQSATTARKGDNVTITAKKKQDEQQQQSPPKETNTSTESQETDGTT